MITPHKTTVQKLQMKALEPNTVAEMGKLVVKGLTNLIDGGFVDDILCSVGISQGAQGFRVVHVGW